MPSSCRPLVAPLVILLLGCGGGTRSFELTLTRPDGGVSRHTLSDDTGFQFDGAKPAFYSWPDIAEWKADGKVGIGLDLAPLQAGTYATGGFLHLGDGTVASARSLSVTATIDRVRWQNSGAYPFSLEGSVKGTASDGHQVEGRFTGTTDDCSDKVRANNSSFFCGMPFPSRAYAEQSWTIGQWLQAGDCPAELLGRYGGGTQLTLSGREAKAGGARSLQCVVTYGNAYRVVCGASEEGVSLDGCTWGVAAFATPGAVSSHEPKVFIVAGTTGPSCPAKACTLSASGFTHVSGAAPTP